MSPLQRFHAYRRSSTPTTKAEHSSRSSHLSTATPIHVPPGSPGQSDQPARLMFSLDTLPIFPPDHTSSPVRKKDASAETIRRSAQHGLRTPSTALPFRGQIQRSFGRHDVSQIRAHLGPEATASALAMNASAYTTGNHVVFAGKPDLVTVAHEAAHAVQQRQGVRLVSGIGRVGDPYERKADVVAARVSTHQSAEEVLGPPVTEEESEQGSQQQGANSSSAPSFNTRQPALHNPLHLPARRQASLSSSVIQRKVGFEFETTLTIKANGKQIPAKNELLYESEGQDWKIVPDSSNLEFVTTKEFEEETEQYGEEAKRLEKTVNEMAEAFNLITASFGGTASGTSKETSSLSENLKETGFPVVPTDTPSSTIAHEKEKLPTSEAPLEIAFPSVPKGSLFTSKSTEDPGFPVVPTDTPSSTIAHEKEKLSTSQSVDEFGFPIVPTEKPSHAHEKENPSTSQSIDEFGFPTVPTEKPSHATAFEEEKPKDVNLEEERLKEERFQEERFQLKAMKEQVKGVTLKKVLKSGKHHPFQGGDVYAPKQKGPFVAVPQVTGGVNLENILNLFQASIQTQLPLKSPANLLDVVRLGEEKIERLTREKTPLGGSGRFDKKVKWAQQSKMWAESYVKHMQLESIQGWDKLQGMLGLIYYYLQAGAGQEGVDTQAKDMLSFMSRMSFSAMYQALPKEIQPAFQPKEILKVAGLEPEKTVFKEGIRDKLGGDTEIYYGPIRIEWLNSIPQGKDLMSREGQTPVTTGMKASSPAMGYYPKLDPGPRGEKEQLALIEIRSLPRSITTEEWVPLALALFSMFRDVQQRKEK